MRKYLFIPVFAALMSCKISAVENSSVASGSVSITMEGKTHILKDMNWNQSKASFENGEIQFLFWDQEYPVRLNLNFTSQTILEKGSDVYEIPQANSPKVLIDLNFFNSDRKSSRLNKRIVFRKGTIRIQQLTRHRLEMSFEGEGSGIMEHSASFAITGTVKVDY